jgi:hypothetical protein
MWIVAIWRPKMLAALAAGCLLVVVAQSARAQAYQFTTFDYPSATDTRLNGISGETIVGSALVPGQPGRTGFSYNGLSFTTLAIPGTGGADGLGDPLGIFGETIVGGYLPAGAFVGQGFELNGSMFTTIDDPLSTGGTQANGVYANTIVGSFSDEMSVFGGQGTEGGVHGFSYNGTAFITLNDPLSPNGTAATGISGPNIVGIYADDGVHGFLFNGSTYTTLNDPLAFIPASGPGGTYVFGISGSNVVGFYYDGSGLQNGFIYDGSSYTTLDDPLGADGTEALGIDGTTVVGEYFDSSDVGHGFIATPVPEPGSITLVLLGTMALLHRRRRRDRAQ